MDRIILTRLISGFFIILIFSVAFIVKGYYFILLFYSLLIGCAIEFSKLTELSAKYTWLLVSMISFLFILFSIHYLIFPIGLITKMTILGSILFLLICYCVYLFDNKNKAINYLTTMFSGVLCLLPPFLLFSIMVAQSEGYDFPMALFVLIWVQDSFAFLIGKLFGKSQLMVSVSPNKTWEGFIGASIVCLIVSLGLNYFLHSLTYFDCVILAIIVIIFGTLGDLIQSKLKRHFSVKDTGTFIPGHGGLLDRMDSFLLVTPSAFIYFAIN